MQSFLLRNLTRKGAIRRLLPKFLAVSLATFWAAGPAEGAGVQLTRVSNLTTEISGGTGKGAWRLRYGTLPQSGFEPLEPRLVPSEGDRAWYSYGGWLRLIDTQKGVVIGRWHFPGEIVSLTPEGAKIKVETSERTGIANQDLRRMLELDPGAPRVPYWPAGFLMLYEVPISESESLWPISLKGAPNSKLPFERAQQILPQVEEEVRRDPFTPWFGVALGKTLTDLGDPRAKKVYEEAIDSPGTDFSELFSISAYFDGLGERDLARAAFERGYRDFWTKGNDPRLFVVLIGRLVLYRLPAAKANDPDTPLGREYIERMYRLMPYGEAAEFAWRLYADYWRAKGQNDEARLWQARFEDTRRNGGMNWWGSERGTGSLDRTLLLIPAGILAVVAYWLVLFLRYLPARRLDKAAAQRLGQGRRGFILFNTEYWSWAERLSFFVMVLVVWIAMGVGGQYLQFALRRASMPIGAGMGNLGGPATVNRLGTDWLPASPYRDLLLAFAYQQDGQPEKAEELYRRLPQFAESWNNLGVILRSDGRNQEAKQAFEKALELDPAQAEAALNLGRPPSTLWTEMHQKYLPGRLMLAPPRGLQWDRAFLGGSMVQMYARALLGPFSVQDAASLFHLVHNLAG